MTISRRHFMKGSLALGFTGAVLISREAYSESIPRLPPVQADGRFPDLANTAIAVFCGEDERLEQGLALLANTAAPALMVSGISPDNWTSRWQPQLPKDLLARVTVDFDASNTQENASNTIRWLKHNKLDNVVLVTADYHMERSLTLLAGGCAAGTCIIQCRVETGADIGTWLGERVKLASTRLGLSRIPGFQLG